ncbi:TRIC cation channel family protein [Allobranchiibius sp. GilTou38]|uniref:trimeric intracellular cation channel family protein n=1 Tax=Allobranchiibius sp. GilTou38 TaxID=2815210 RepID=UPI001AA0CB81|nr:TRIC cation channel family protein [Allobranchiibius sp. GilTou38]MBO1768347.1 TRIC cation channel family protein [Allobranchiibius sp. GilTou38]
MYGSGHLTELFRVLDLTGVLANATLGGVIARAEKLDPFGFATLAVLSGLGGGIIRDVLLQHGTPVALTDYAYLVTALVGAAISFVIRVQGRAWDRVWPIIDAVALGTWAAAGAAKTLAAGLGWLPAVLLGMITAVGGGVVRDVVLRRIPGVLGGNTLYATCALGAAGVLVLLSTNGHPTVGLVAATIFGAGLCIIARWRGWMLPSADAWSPARVVPPAYRQRIRHRIDPEARQRRRAAQTDSAPETARPEETP